METDKETLQRLLSQLSLLRKEYQQGKIQSLTWIRARREVMREAEFLGVTDLLLKERFYYWEVVQEEGSHM